MWILKCTFLCDKLFLLDFKIFLLCFVFFQSSDEVFIYGVSTKSESLLVRISRNTNHESEAWIYLKLSDGRSFYLDKIDGYQSSTDGKITSFTCGGLKMYPLSAMRRWRISYSGMLKYSFLLLHWWFHF